MTMLYTKTKHVGHILTQKQNKRFALAYDLNCFLGPLLKTPLIAACARAHSILSHRRQD